MPPPIVRRSKRGRERCADRDIRAQHADVPARLLCTVVRWTGMVIWGACGRLTTTKGGMRGSSIGL
ncbi:hypothetical protein STANM309S_00233 [Streptomyces tanashiensis]